MGKKLFLGVVLLLMLTSAAPRAAAAENTWYAEYFNNRDLSGAPVITRYETDLHFEWGNGSPGEGIPADGFSARFVHDEWMDAGMYRFSYRADDGLRLWVDDVLVIDDWRDSDATWTFVEYYLNQGTHRVRVEYYENSASAVLQISWAIVSAGTPWRGDYFSRQDLTGPAAFTRNDPAIDFDWGYGSPGSGVPEDHFSVRWSRTPMFEAGTYRFYASCDDGVRIYVDGALILDEWKKQKLPNTQLSSDRVMSAGQHALIVEYFEEGGEASAHIWWNRVDTLSGWEGRYYANREVRGGPSLIRDDQEINFNWGEGAPVQGMPSDNFSIAWTRQINFAPGLYRFNVLADDGFRLWIDDTYLHMNYWEPQDSVWRYQDWYGLEGVHTLRLEYYEGTGSAKIQFWWDYAATIAAAQAMPPSPVYGFPKAPAVSAPATTAPSGRIPSTVLPVSQPTAVPSSPPPGPWQGEYFTGQDFTQKAALVRTDAAIDFNWGIKAPATELPADNFAVRWTGKFTFEAGRYRFSTTTDDGVRLYVDDKLVIDSWRAMRGTRTATVDLTAESHAVRVEYFEKTQAASARVTWVKVGSAAAPTVAPTPKPAATPVATPVSGMEATWTAQYYTGTDLAGTPVLATSFKGPLSFDWGTQSPGKDVPSDRFSAAFETTAEFTAGRYRFTTTSDDGIRLYVDGKRVLNSWYAMRGSRSVTLNLEAGKHTVRLEYFERTGAAKVTLQTQALD
ncbi:MAG: hypothetical protein JXA21_00325 [Anaerolineae bacterium]|nr:hypothetical protein [Anaerolineae bacterium]